MSQPPTAPAVGNSVAVLRLVDQLRPALARNDRGATARIVAELVSARAPMGPQWMSLARIAAGIGEMRLFREALDLFVAHGNDPDLARYQQAALLAEVGDWAEAYRLLCTLPAAFPDPASNAYSRGIALLNLGQAGEAREHLLRATRLRPDLGSPWLALAMATDFAREPALGDHIVAGEAGIAASATEQRAPYYDALGKVHADRGEHALAFRAYSRGAECSRAIVSYNPAQDRAEAAEAVRGYSAERIADIARQQSEPTADTIFVTGLPRTGTTLVEQILTSHSAVSDGAETNRLYLLAQEIGGRDYPKLLSFAAGPGPAQAARLWHHWLDEMFPGRGRVVDKTVDASRALGLAAALLPEAPLVWMTRDPLDCAWSCFRTNFAGKAMPWSNDLRTIADHFRLEAQLLATWQDILGDRLLVMPYEALATDPGSSIRTLAAHCGLAEQPQMFAPHEHDRVVTTASMMQVRQPINRAAIGSAEPYRAYLEPFVERYFG